MIGEQVNSFSSITFLLFAMQFQYIYRQSDTQQTIFYAWFEAMHTRIDIALCNLPEVVSKAICEKMQTEIIRIAKFSNRFDPESEITLVNCNAAHRAVKITGEFYEIIEDCIFCYEKTEGLFDITVQSCNGYRDGIYNIELGSEEKTVFFKHQDIQIDLCGYIKGYALDKVKAILLENKCADALVSIGNSSVLALGNHPNGKGWKVNLPGEGKGSITLFNECLTSSGNTPGHYHIIDPVKRETISSAKIMSVVTESGVVGEVLSTALCVSNLKPLNFVYKVVAS